MLIRSIYPESQLIIGLNVLPTLQGQLRTNTVTGQYTFNILLMSQTQHKHRKYGLTTLRLHTVACPLTGRHGCPHEIQSAKKTCTEVTGQCLHLLVCMDALIRPVQPNASWPILKSYENVHINRCARKHISFPINLKVQADLLWSKVTGEVGCVGKSRTHNDEAVRAGPLTQVTDRATHDVGQLWRCGHIHCTVSTTVACLTLTHTCATQNKY